MKISLENPKRHAFTMIEMLIVIAIIGIMSALVIASFSNAAQDSRRVVARQQQAAVQNAVNAWVSYESTVKSLFDARKTYNDAGNGKARLALVQRYLDSTSVSHFGANTTDDNKIQSAALKKTGQYLQLGAWTKSSYPKVELK